MKEIKIYEAYNGTKFESREECLKYEQTMSEYLEKELKAYKIGETDEYEMSNGMGSEEYDIDIYKIENADVLSRLNTFRLTQDSSVKEIPDEYIGKTILLHWDYEKCWSWFETLDEYKSIIEKAYYTAIERGVK